MAVQKNKKTRSKRNMRRSHDKIKPFVLSKDPLTGEQHIRHHVSLNGYYKGKIVKKYKKKHD